MRLSRPCALALLTAAACADAPAQLEPTAPPEGLPASRILTRSSLDVRGVRPSLAEIEAVRSNPAALDALVESFVDDPRFVDRVKAMFAPAFRTRVDFYPDLYDDPETIVAIGEEPLDLVAYIAVNDLPFSRIVLADHTVVRPVLFDLWPLREAVLEGELPPGTVGARYGDGRPHAGVLTMNAVWWRHTSTLENANRGRANALSRALLCESWLDRPVDFPRDIDLSDSESIHGAIRLNPACTACHATMDPVASYLWGFMYPEEGLEGRVRYRPERERDWARNTERAPGFFGEPGSHLVDLGLQIAADPRFVRCAVKRVYEELLGRPATLEDDGAIAEHREAFVRSGLRLKALVRSVLRDPAYRGARRTTTFGGRPEPVALKLVGPETLQSVLEDLTGYRAVLERRDLLSIDYGARVTAGGSDRGYARSPSTGLSLVHRRLSEAAARTAVRGTTRGTLHELIDRRGFSEAPDLLRLASLVALVHARPIDPGGEEVAALLELYEDLYDLSDDPEEAWTGLLTAILADPSMLLY